jgi:hypothetical protein
VSSSSELATAPPAALRRDPARAADGDRPARALWSPWTWMLVLAAVIAASWWFVHWSGMRPSFDPFGWLEWGHQIIYGHLNLNAAPSWKPLPFLFTLPFALFGATAVQLWSITAIAGTILMGVFAGRIVYRLTGVGPGSGRWALTAAWLGALFAACGVVGMHGIPKLAYIANSDGLNTALVLAAIDAHLSRRPRLAYVVLFAAALGRPEVWPFSFLYGIWLVRRVPGTRLLVLGGWVLILVAWYLPDGIWASSLNEAGKLDLNKASACSDARPLCVVRRWGPGLFEWPMQVAGGIAVAVALLTRDRRVLWLLGAALLWVVVEIAFALHGFSAVSRYLMESEAVIIVIAGWGVGRLLAGLPGILPAGARWAPAAGTLVVLALLAALVPATHHRLYQWRIGADHARAEGVVNRNLSRAVSLAGGPRAVLACGTPAALNQHQSQLAWAMGVNVANVLFNPPLLKRIHRRMVLFTQQGSGWRVRAFNVPTGLAARCAHTVDVDNGTAPTPG